MAHRATFSHGERLALFIAAAVVLGAAAAASLSLEGLSAGSCQQSPTQGVVNV
ncbi:MAG: hypothetical protein M3Z75_12110 [Actinomycetota bacterium]|nr:hypothetical protein [Actinomycetota bacterium]